MCPLRPRPLQSTRSRSHSRDCDIESASSTSTQSHHKMIRPLKCGLLRQVNSFGQSSIAFSAFHRHLSPSLSSRRTRRRLNAPTYLELSRGEGGIRTLDTPKGIPVFETGRFNHSRTSPVIFRRTIRDFQSYRIERRGWDSNPRTAFDGNSLSRRADSTTLAPLQIIPRITKHSCAVKRVNLILWREVSKEKHRLQYTSD